MKPLSVAELNSYCEYLNEVFDGALLQKVDSEVEFIYFEFYRRGVLNFVVSLKQLEPHFFFADSLGLRRKKIKKVTPVQVFCQANLRGLKFVSLHVDVNAGRVVVMTLTDGQDIAEVRMTLIPRSVNLAVFAHGKKISWHKPRELPQSQSGDLVLKDSPDWDHWNQKALEHYNQVGVPKAQNAPQFEKQIQKKQKALESLENDLSNNLKEKIQQEALAQELKMNPGVVVKELEGMSYGEALGQTFEKIKKIALKISSQEERVRSLREEIEQLKNKQLTFTEVKGSPLVEKKVKESLLAKAEATGRQKIIQERFHIVMGKSAKDNLNLLRKASAWDYWIHLKDQPSAFAILSRNRNEVVSDEVLREGCIWFLEEIHKKKSMDIESLKYEFLVGECRNVSPIKGDKLGRVTHRSMRTFSVSMKSRK